MPNARKYTPRKRKADTRSPDQVIASALGVDVPARAETPAAPIETPPATPTEAIATVDVSTPPQRINSALAAHTIRTPDRARELSQLRWSKAARKAREALRDGTESPTWSDGAYKVAREQVAIAMSGGRGSTQAARFVWDVSGLAREKQTGTGAPDTGAVLALSTDAAAAIARVLAGMGKRDGE